MPRTSKYKPELCDQLIELMGHGKSFEAVCGDFGISRDTGYEWIKKYPEFAEAKGLGVSANQSFWEAMGIENLVSHDKEKFNAQVWIFTMKNIHGWRDKKDITTNSGIGDMLKNMTPAETDAKIAEVLSRLQTPKK